ncbi:MAG: preprotein translocase subunit SecA [Candidatus Latescibacteria bacterium]|nr:preprotein translocase subunit SecA [Candidatus Latescibacterota bacterium]
MFNAVIKKVFGSQSDREFKKSTIQIDEINRLTSELEGLSEAEIQAQTAAFRQGLVERLADRTARLQELEGQLRGDLEPAQREPLNDQYDALDAEIRQAEADYLDEIASRAFALVKQACIRLQGRQWDRAGEPVEWDMVPYDVQLFGGLVLHQGKVAEMATGEGKTLVATMPLYLNALTDRGVHLITHNDFLAKRDGMWMGPLFNFLGLSVGIVQNAEQMGGAEGYILPAPEGVPESFKWQQASRQEAYGADIVYATKDQVGFDYLRDNMATRLEDITQREFNFAIVDEADSNLIDDARTPLIIAGNVPDATNQYAEMKPLVDRLIRAQTGLVNKIVADVDKRRQEGGDEYEIGIELLRATRGAPKNKRLLKMLQDEGIKKLIGRVEADYIRDKRMQEIDEGLYYAVDERSRTIDPMEKGRDMLSPDEQALFVLPDISEEIDLIRKEEGLSDDEKRLKEDEAYRQHSKQGEGVHNINQLMQAYTLFEKDVQYMVDEGRVVIVDESTGRPQPGRRFADGLHQALEAKENVKIRQETQTIATITLQNLFRLYRKLAGMTGTAETEAGELWQIYKLDVTVIPTNRPVRRVDQNDFIFRTKREKYNAIIEEVGRLHESGLPVLVGTVSVEVSELLSRMLNRQGIKHQLLNARYHAKESQIVSQAGQPGTVTIATNMAGRGTDIKLTSEVVGLDKEVIESAMTLDDRGPAGKPLRQQLTDEPRGLQVIGTERHEARRIDRQLRGRSGRQGDPGGSRFFLSLEDDLMRLFGSERIASVMDRLGGAEEGEVIEHSMVTRSIERAQKKVEARNFEMRKHVLDYDDVMNQQRQVIYDRRRDMLERDSVRELVQEMVENTVGGLVAQFADGQMQAAHWDWDGLQSAFGAAFFMGFSCPPSEREEMDAEGLRQLLLDTIREAYDRRVGLVGEDSFRQIEKAILLHTVDTCWQEHLHEMDELKEGVGFAGVGGKNPLIEYKKGAFDLFERLIERIDQESLNNLFRLRVDTEAPPTSQPRTGGYNMIHRDSTNLGFDGARSAGPTPARRPAQPLRQSGGGSGEETQARQPVRVGPKINRNAPCPCGSGKKYKQCCLKKTA